MPSFSHKPDNRRQVYLSLVSQIEGQLRDAYARRHETAGETQSSLAERLGVNRSAVHKRLTGQTNMTLKTLAEMIWALRHCIKIEIFDPDAAVTNGRVLVPITPLPPSSRIEMRSSTKAVTTPSIEPWVMSSPGGRVESDSEIKRRSEVEVRSAASGRVM